LAGCGGFHKWVNVSKSAGEVKKSRSSEYDLKTTSKALTTDTRITTDNFGSKSDQAVILDVGSDLNQS